VEEPSDRVLAAVLAGDVDKIAALQRYPVAELTAAASRGPLLLTGSAVARVLRRYANGELSDVDVQAWASFVRRGYLLGGGGTGPVQPMPIDWEADQEDAIAAAIERLDELGDAVDGSLDSAELDQLIRSLN